MRFPIALYAKAVWLTFEYWLVLAFDVLVLYSTVFALVFLLHAVLAALLPRRMGLAGRSGAMPLCLAVAAALCLTPGADVLTRLLAVAGNPLLEAPASVFWLALGWFIGAVFFLARLTLSYLAVRRLLRGAAVSAPDPAADAARRVTGVSGDTPVLRCSAEAPIASWGIFRAAVVTPAHFLEEYSPEDRLGIYLHEFAHIRRRDPLVSFFLSLVRCLLWHDPFIARAVRHSRINMEMACDRAVLDSGVMESHEYAALLVKAAAAKRHPPPGLSNGFEALKLRLAFICSDEIGMQCRDRRWCGALSAVGLVLVIAAGCWLARSGIRLRSVPPEPVLTFRDASGEMKSYRRNIHFWRDGIFGYYISASMEAMDGEEEPEGLKGRECRD